MISEVTGSNPVEVLTLSGFDTQLLNCVHNCDDHGLLKNLNVGKNSNLGKPILFFLFVLVILKRKNRSHLMKQIRNQQRDGLWRTEICITLGFREMS